MGSLRIGRALESLSSGLGLFAEKSMRDEQARIDREWQLTLAGVRESNAQSRQAASFEHAESLAASQNAAAGERDTTRFAHSEKMAKTAAGAREIEFSQRRVDDARQALNKNLLELEKARLKEIESTFDPDQKAMVSGRYDQLKDQAIVGTVSWLASQGLPGYEVKNESGLQALLSQNGMSQVVAKDHANQIWRQINPQAAPRADPYANGGRDAMGLTRADREERIAGYNSDLNALETGGTLPARAAAPAAPQPAAPQPAEQPLFVEPQSYSSPDPRGQLGQAAGRKAWDFLQTPIPYGQ